MQFDRLNRSTIKLYKVIENLNGVALAASRRTKSTKSGSRVAANFKYCIESVKSNDYEAYLSTLVGPKEIMRASIAIRALNIELMSIPKHNREVNVSIAKLQFWKDQLEKIYSSITPGNADRISKLNEPVSHELSIIIRKHDLSKSWFTRLIDGRKLFFTQPQFANMTQLEQCADLSNPHYLLLQCMGHKSVDCDHAASHLGKSQLICGVVRGIVRRSTQAVFYLPADLMLKHRIAQQDLIAFNEKMLANKRDQLRDLAFELCTRAHQHLNSARALQDKVPKNARLVLVQSVGCENFLDYMQKYDFDITNPKLNSDFRHKLLFKLIAAKLRNKY